MIGVIAEKREQAVVEEFFELFKTPWEFAREGKRYDALVMTADTADRVNAPVVIVYGSGHRGLDNPFAIRMNESQSPVLLSWQGRRFPIYGKAVTLDGPGEAVLVHDGDRGVGGVRMADAGRQIYRFGFDLFQEVEHLLREGQPEGHAAIPALDFHIDLLRECVLSADVPLVEIPPCPPGHRFIACLTHDVDFVGIRPHRFDATMFGFVYRALFESAVRALRGTLTWEKVWKNWKAVVSLPGIFLGIQKDFLIQFDRYAEMEGGLRSTYYLVPFKSRPGMSPEGRDTEGRGVKYDIDAITSEMKKLVHRGCEIGLHGIDAWHDAEKGSEERMRIQRATGTGVDGVRMHWLFFAGDSPRVLEQAGFLYDSTAGYNEAVGYLSGTSQPYRLPGTNLYELPLHVMDTALLSPGRMGLSEEDAFERIREIVSHVSAAGGVFTLNWHHRSVGPERFWDDLYVRILEELRKNGAFFATARDAVCWFRKRRSAVFWDMDEQKGIAQVRLEGESGGELPDLIFRVHKRGGDPEDTTVAGEGLSVAEAVQEFSAEGTVR